MGPRPPGSAHTMACPGGYRPGDPGDKRAGARIPMGHAFFGDGKWFGSAVKRHTRVPILGTDMCKRLEVLGLESGMGWH